MALSLFSPQFVPQRSLAKNVKYFQHLLGFYLCSYCLIINVSPTHNLSVFLNLNTLRNPAQSDQISNDLDFCLQPRLICAERMRPHEQKPSDKHYNDGS